MRKYSLLTFILVGLFCSISLLVHFFASDRTEMDAYLKNSDDISVSEGKLENNGRSDENLESNAKNILNGIDSKSKSFNIDTKEYDHTEETKIVPKGGENKEIRIYNDGKKGISKAELYSMHEYQLTLIEKELNNPDAIVIEATEFELAITRKELEALHAEQRLQIQEEINDPNAIVLEATEHQPAMTRAELQALHAEQRYQIQEEINNPNSILIEATDEYPAITRGEIEALHSRQLDQIRQEAENPDTVAFKNEDGSIVTNKMLSELHEHQNYEIFKSNFDGDVIIISEDE